MSQEVKQRYQQLAAQLPSPSDNNYDNWQETQQILSMLFNILPTHYVLPQLFIIRLVKCNARHGTNTGG